MVLLKSQNQEKTKKSHFQYLYELLKAQRKSVIVVFILMIIATLARVGEPLLYKVIVDNLTIGISTTFTDNIVRILGIAVGIWALLAIISNILGAYQAYISWNISGNASTKMHLNGYRRVLKMDYEHHTKESSSRLSKIIDDADTATWDLLNWWLYRFIPAGFGFITVLIITFTISLPMTLVAVSVIPIYVVVIIYFIKKNEERQHKINKFWRISYEHMYDQISNIVTYKLNQNEPLFVNRQKKYMEDAYNAQKDLNKKWRTTQMLNFDVVARFLVMGIGIFFVRNGSITLGTLFMFMGYLNEIFVPLNILGDILPQYSRKARHIDKFIELMAKRDHLLEKKDAIKIEKLYGKIEFKNVSFRYKIDGDSEIIDTIKDISFVINQGEQLAIVGHSGAGKTTIVWLMTRLVDPASGQILIDDIDIKEYKIEDLRRQIGVVLQEHSLYDETALENISYGKPSATRDEIMEAAKKAQAHDFISRLPNGYDTLIGERGVRLSGGEKQRIAIARAILKNPQIVILDEPTSALDSITEAQVQKGLITLIENKTSIVIAHRLSTVRNADKIILLEKGKIVAFGSHSELMRKSAIYAEMVELQTGGFLAE